MRVKDVGTGRARREVFPRCATDARALCRERFALCVDDLRADERCALWCAECAATACLCVRDLWRVAALAETASNATIKKTKNTARIIGRMRRTESMFSVVQLTPWDECLRGYGFV